MIIRVKSLRHGYEAEPVELTWRAKFAKHMLDMTGIADDRVFWQGDYALPEEILAHREYTKYLKRGWDMRIRVDPETYGHWLGYDANSIE